MHFLIPQGLRLICQQTHSSFGLLVKSHFTRPQKCLTTAPSEVYEGLSTFCHNLQLCSESGICHTHHKGHLCQVLAKKS